MHSCSGRCERGTGNVFQQRISSLHFITACAGLSPSASELAQTPQIRFGQPLPKEDNYVLLYPAGHAALCGYVAALRQLLAFERAPAIGARRLKAKAA